MSLLTPYQRLLKNLREEVDPHSRAYMPRQDALDELRASSGLDYGYDAEQWEAWVRKNSDELD